MAIKDPEIESQARQEWLKGLIENSINSDLQINAGLAKCRAHSSPFLPSIGQFITWCKESIGSLANWPTESEAKLAMIRELGRSPDIRDWHTHHPAVYWAYGQRDSFDWKQMSIKDMNSNFSEVWNIATKKAREGYEFTLPVPQERQLTQDEQNKEYTKEQVEKARADFFSILNDQTIDDKPEDKQLTQDEINDLQRLEKIKNGGKFNKAGD